MKCAVCGKTIIGSNYYSLNKDDKVCSTGDCFSIYFWRKNLEAVNQDTKHEYPIIGGFAYYIGSDYDNPRGMGGTHFTIEFNDGTIRETNSLWCKGVIPDIWREQMPDNAKFKG